MVQSVEKFSAELHRDAFGNRSIFDHRKIQSLETWPAERPSPEVAPRPNGWKRKRGRIKPLCLFFQQDRPRKGRIQVGTIRIPGVSISGPVRTDLRSERKPA